MENKAQLVTIQEEINKELASPEILNTLVSYTFKGLNPSLAKRALIEGMMIGFSFKDFLQKNVYAIPFGNSYSIVGSIDYCRKVGMRSGIVGVEAPIFTEDDKKRILSCSVTVKKKVGSYIGDFTALVYFNEYSTGRNLWVKKPRTMLSKVAEMHALRKACPEELSQVYIEEENESEKNNLAKNEERNKDEKKEVMNKLSSCKDIKQLQNIWASLSGNLKAEKEILKLKDDLKIKLSKVEVKDKKNVINKNKKV